MTNNAFEDKDKQIAELKVATPELDEKIQRIETQIKALRGMNLHRTAALNQQKLDRLLQERRELQEG